MTVVEAVGLRRTYRTSTGILRRNVVDVEAVRGVSFAVGKGELYGLLGPNGAGKTTTIKMLITLLLPTSGTARVLGHDVVASAPQVRSGVADDGYFVIGNAVQISALAGVYGMVMSLANEREFGTLSPVLATPANRPPVT